MAPGEECRFLRCLVRVAMNLPGHLQKSTLMATGGHYWALHT